LTNHLGQGAMACPVVLPWPTDHGVNAQWLVSAFFVYRVVVALTDPND